MCPRCVGWQQSYDSRPTRDFVDRLPTYTIYFHVGQTSTAALSGARLSIRCHREFRLICMWKTTLFETHKRGFFLQTSVVSSVCASLCNWRHVHVRTVGTFEALIDTRAACLLRCWLMQISKKNTNGGIFWSVHRSNVYKKNNRKTSIIDCAS